MAQTQKSGVKPILYKLVLAEETRSEDSKGRYPAGRVKQIFDIMRAEMSKLMWVNLWFFLFALPLMFVIIWLSPYLAQKVMDSFNFMGNLGIGYPGTVDSLSEGAIKLYDAYRLCYLAFVPACLFLAAGLAGLFNVCKKALWGENFKPTKDFFAGVKKYYFKMLALLIPVCLVVEGISQSILWLMILYADGASVAGAWVLVIAVSIAGIMLLVINLFAMPMTVAYDMKLAGVYKNSLILASQMPVFGLLILAIVLIPVFLALFVPSIMILIYLLMIMFGFSFVGLSVTSFAGITFDNIITPLYQARQAQYNKNRKTEKKKR